MSDQHSPQDTEKHEYEEYIQQPYNSVSIWPDEYSSSLNLNPQVARAYIETKQLLSAANCYFLLLERVPTFQSGGFYFFNMV